MIDGSALQASEGAAVRREFNVLALLKGDERYVYVYDDDSSAELLNAFRDQAADPNLSFTWFDATVLTGKAREQLQANDETGSQSRLPADS